MNYQLYYYTDRANHNAHCGHKDVSRNFASDTEGIDTHTYAVIRTLKGLVREEGAKKEKRRSRRCPAQELNQAPSRC